MIAACKIIRELAKGGQKTVFLAEHPELGSVVIKRGTMRSFTSLERIRREVELLSELKSKYYPTQYHFNVDLKTKEFEIIEGFVEGKTLRDSFSAFRKPKEIFTLLNFLVDGLSLIWDRKIVHRDLKPENIIVNSQGFPCIIDLGIARFLELESLTKTISPMGPCTPIYAAPEQLANNRNLIDLRTDFFALGIIALELYLGVHPFDSAHSGGKFSIAENIMRGKYIFETDTVKRNDSIAEFAKMTLQAQPYERFRNWKMMKNFIAEQVSK